MTVEIDQLNSWIRQGRFDVFARTIWNDFDNVREFGLECLKVALEKLFIQILAEGGKHLDRTLSDLNGPWQITAFRHRGWLFNYVFEAPETKRADRIPGVSDFVRARGSLRIN